jgi:hypothetical protein
MALWGQAEQKMEGLNPACALGILNIMQVFVQNFTDFICGAYDLFVKENKC